MKVKNQRGSASVIALCLVLVLTIMSAGVAFMMNTEGRLATENKDLIEAKYAAESGAKRAIIEFEKINDSKTPDWTWLNKDKAFIDNIGTKKYKVIIYEKGDTTKTNVTPVTTASKTYTIQATGMVNGVSKTMLLDVNVTSLSAPGTPYYVGDAAFYSDAAVTVSADFKNNTEVHGASSYTVGGTESKKAITYDPGYSQFENYKSLVFPKISYDQIKKMLTIGTKSYDFSSAQLITNSTTAINLTESNHYAAYATGDWAPQSTVTIYGSGVIYVAGNLLLDQNVTIDCKDPAGILFVVNGNITSTTNGSNNFKVVNAAMLVGGAVVGTKNNFDIKGTLVSKGTMDFKNNATFNYDAVVANTWLPTTANGGSPGGTGTGAVVAKIVDKSWKLL